METPQHQEIILYLDNAREMLEVAQVMLANDFYPSAINRAYYAIFYAANALLVTNNMTQAKHSGVISVFRQHFVKTGLIDPEFSKIYGRAMEDRHESDYELESPISKEDAQENLNGAVKFVSEVERWLQQEKWI
ncbi:MAG: HEPN domain-containing protein [Anaerolineales bacterium]|nr:HEPN domain-containing protein [Anaerolineales bacterium]